jgi:hypothetical protein
MDVKTKTERRAASAVYMAQHREAWRTAGFVGLSTMVHEDDCTKVRAYVDVLKYEKLLALVKADDADAIELAATRNVQKLRSLLIDSGKVREAAEAHGKATVAQVNALLKAAETYAAKFATWRGVSAEDEFDDKAAALRVVYGNLYVATFKLAEALASSPKSGENEDE